MMHGTTNIKFTELWIDTINNTAQ